MILWTGQQWVDPVMSLAVAAVILWSSVGLLKESVWMSLHGVPQGIDGRPGRGGACASSTASRRVHDLHIWPLSTTETALTAHIVTRRADYPDALLASARDLLHDRFRIEHCTIQMERHHLEPIIGIAESVNVTHLECSLTGERYEAGKVHNLSRAGKPLLVRYDLEAREADADPRQPCGARAGHVEVARAAAA